MLKELGEVNPANKISNGELAVCSAYDRETGLCNEYGYACDLCSTSLSKDIKEGKL